MSQGYQPRGGKLPPPPTPSHAAPATGVKRDNGKPPLSLVDRHAIEEIGRVLAFGAQKYAAHNWRRGIAYSRLLDAALRHLYAFADGEDNDPESGLSHIAHAGCCVVFLLGMIRRRPDVDDRWTTPARRENERMSDDSSATFGPSEHEMQGKLSPKELADRRRYSRNLPHAEPDASSELRASKCDDPHCITCGPGPDAFIAP